MTLFLDLDGTLLDISEKYYQIYNEGIGQSNEPFNKFLFWELKRKGLDDTTIFEIMRFNINIDSFREWKKQVIESEKFLAFDTLHPSTLDLLHTLSKKYKLVLITMRKRRKSLINQIESLGINNYFQEVLSSNESYENTDGKELKTSLIHSFLATKQKAIIVGDSNADIISGNKLGLFTVAVLSGIRNYDYLKKLSPSYIIPSIYHLPTIINSIH